LPEELRSSPSSPTVQSENAKPSTTRSARTTAPAQQLVDRLSEKAMPSARLPDLIVLDILEPVQKLVVAGSVVELDGSVVGPPVGVDRFVAVVHVELLILLLGFIVAPEAHRI